jgi:hypothetical protein
MASDVSSTRHTRCCERYHQLPAVLPIGGISQSIARHAFLVLRVSTLPSRAATQTLRALGRGWVMFREEEEEKN